MNIELAFEIVSSHYNIPISSLKQLLTNNMTNNKNNIVSESIIIPHNGKVIEECCKGVLFNHGLYTQCKKKVKSRFCNNCISEKYGNIEERNKYKIGSYITKEGKKEVDYCNFVKKKGYNIEDVNKILRENNIDYFIENKDINNGDKKPRGRPKKLVKEEIINEDELLEEIEVTRIYIEDKYYLKTQENVLLDVNSYEIIGMFINDKIVKS